MKQYATVDDLRLVFPVDALGLTPEQIDNALAIASAEVDAKIEKDAADIAGRVAHRAATLLLRSLP